MNFEETLNTITTLTFDCYGTLIDWETGLRRAFQESLGPFAEDRLRRVFDAYLDAEMEVEKEVMSTGFEPYRSVVAQAVLRAARRLDLACSPEQARAVADSVGRWPPFADTTSALGRLKTRYELGILSNVDRDLFAQTARGLGVDFDVVITAQDVRSYKPGHAHFRRYLDAHGPAEKVLHVAQSVYHDGVPARALGIPFAWINRRGEVNVTEARPLAEFSTLAAFADAACRTG